MEGQVLLQGAALPVADDGHRLAVEQGDAAQDAAVLGAQAVAPLLKEIGKQVLDEICRAGALRVAGQGL